MKGHWNILIYFLIAVILTLLIGYLFPPAQAYPWVTQGSVINQTETYDLRGVYGFSGKLGWWKSSWDEGADDIEPDVIIDLNEKKNYAVYIDPKEWNVGNWYQWDGVGKNGHGNTFVFRVNYSQGGTGNNNNSTLSLNNIPVTTVTTIPPTPTPTRVTVTLQPVPTKPTPTPSPTFKRTPVPVEVIILSVFGAIMVWRVYGK